VTRGEIHRSAREQVLIYRKFVPASATEESRRGAGSWYYHASELPVWRLCARLADGESTFCSKLQTMPPVLPVESFKQSWLERVELNFILLKLEWDRFTKLNR